MSPAGAADSKVVTIRQVGGRKDVFILFLLLSWIILFGQGGVNATKCPLQVMVASPHSRGISGFFMATLMVVTRVDVGLAHKYSGRMEFLRKRDAPVA